MMQRKKGKGDSAGRINAAFDRSFDKHDTPGRPSGFDATVFAPHNSEMREKASKVLANKTVLAGTVMATENIMQAIEKEDGKTEIPFEGGRLRKIKQLSSKDNAVGDVWLAEKIYDNYEESELVVIKMLRSEKEIFNKKEVTELEEWERGLLKRLFLEAGEEIKNLERFADNRHVISPVGEIFPHEGRLVVQMEYAPHTVNEVLWEIEGECELTYNMLEMGIQLLDTTAYLEEHKDDEAELGRVNNDLKIGNLGADKETTEGGKNRIVVMMLDLDSIRPISNQLSIKRETKYSMDHCDPEQFMELHDNNTALNAKPDETVYSTGMVMMYALEERMSVGLENRHIMVLPTEYEEGLARETRPTFLPGEFKTEEITTHVNVININEMKEKITRTRETDELNLLRLYLTNKQRRNALGVKDYDPPQMKKLMEKHETRIINEIIPEVRAGMKWLGNGGATYDEITLMRNGRIVKEFDGIIKTLEVSDETAYSYDAQTPKERLMLGIKLNIAKLTETYAKSNYEWYISASSRFSTKHSWYEAVNELLVNASGLTRSEAGKIVELAKREEKGRKLESTVKPEVFEAIAYCLKPREERMGAEQLSELFKHFRGDIHE